MKRYIVILFAALLLTAQNAHASSYEDPYRERDSVVAPIQIKNKGIYNLVVSVSFLHYPNDAKIYRSDPYDKLMRRLNVEWSRAAVSQILKAKELNINDLEGLRESIEAEITKMAEQLKKNYALDKDAEVVFAITHFYLLEPKER